ncbi:50S ribosomal protein L2 [Thalictrum thalictroides]|uniref:50S ribosomal protein L2 n=1 Tax=Thalictrum thalictroides TaxID=46969 RepID=A0A7J6XDJ6_THATH|nr:50S ribosomal protein L2 [Thalictrum thalictroides]
MLFGKLFLQRSTTQVRSFCSNRSNTNTTTVVVARSLIPAAHNLTVGKYIINSNGGNKVHKYEETSEMLDLNSQIGNCIPLSNIRIGTWVHCIEMQPGQGAKLVRAAGTFAKVLKESSISGGRHCLLRLPSGVEKLIDSRCKATVGQVSNLSHGARKLRKAGHSRWDEYGSLPLLAPHSFKIE